VHDVLVGFHPVVRAWFERRFPAGPSEPQRRGWPAIARGENTLVAAPTGSGKTLAAFLVCIDRLWRESERCLVPEDRTDVVYVSPLRALAADVRVNLEIPLAELRAMARELGHPAPELRSQLRTGDTPASERAAMLRRPPHFLVTTPESLFLLVTAEKSRERLRTVRTIIVDEIHALAGDKRGAHLGLTLERLSALCETPPLRIGLSATQHPIETTARLLVGARPGGERPHCTIVDLGPRRDLELQVEVPGSELCAVASGEQWDEVLDSIAAHARGVRTTLVFVSTRRLAERLAHLLAERLGEDKVAAHHGSLSQERRHGVEEKLRRGELTLVVATASLELGLDVGPLDLVVQIGSPRSLSTLLQRAGRSGHARGATPRAILYPTTRDELVECAACVRGVQQGRLDRVRPPSAPLDLLAQQIVAACAGDTWGEDDLYALVRRSAHFADLAREDFDRVVTCLCEGIPTGNGPRGAWLHRDHVHARLRGRRGARLATLTSGGAIPETADYRVVADPDETFVGTVNEDWAIESMAGDVFLLGSTSWRIRRVEAGVVRVVDAKGAPPSVPFWLGEAPARTAELSQEVSALRREVVERVLADGEAAAVAWLCKEAGLEPAGAGQLVAYLEAGRQALGAMPTLEDVVFERFFDEAGGQQLVIHAPFGARVNRAFGLALRKKFCRTFDFELQAAASDDAIVLSLGPQHGFPLDSVPHMLHSATAREALEQALLRAPAFQVRWRWNLNRALVVLRWRKGNKVPAQLQRMQSDDLLAAVFPSLAACQENVAGPIEVPDHPLAQQTLRDCMTESADVEGLLALLEAMESGAVRLHFCDATEPSPLSHEILNGRPYTFLDDAPLEERRTRAVVLRRGLPLEQRDLAHLDPAAVARVREEARPEPRNAEELHDALVSHVVLRPEPAFEAWHEALVKAGRVTRLEVASGPLWVAAEGLAAATALFPAARATPPLQLPASLAARPIPSSEDAAAAVLRGHLASAGPCTVADLVARTGLEESDVAIALGRLEAEGVALRGRFDPERAPGELEYCDRRLLARIHRYTTERLRREIEPVSAQEFLRFLLRWQHVAPGTGRVGRAGVLATLEQLAGFECAAGGWEDCVLPARMAEYRPVWLDEICLSGELAWARLGLPTPVAPEEAGGAPSRATPLSFVARANLAWSLAAARGDEAPTLPGDGVAREVHDCLQSRGALFQGELVSSLRRLPAEIDEALWELVGRGVLTADGFGSVRALLSARERWSRRTLPGAAARKLHGGAGPRRLRRGAREGASEGRWALLPAPDPGPDREALAEAVAEQLLARWGVLFRDAVARESLCVPWREIVWALRRLEARGLVRGGRFVTGFTGEQYALPEAVDALREGRRRPRTGERVWVSAVDPLNLVGILTPGPRVPAVRTRSILYVDGLPVKEHEDGLPRAGDLLEAGRLV
jgi:ATP-dependent Lhr-like helicase